MNQQPQEDEEKELAEMLQWVNADISARKAKMRSRAISIVNLINPRTDAREACLEDVFDGLSRLESDGSYFQTIRQSTEAKQKLFKFSSALARATIAWKELLKPQTLAALPELMLTEEYIEKVEFVLAFGRRCGNWKEDAQTIRADTALKREAVKWAYRLFKKYGVKPSATKKDSHFCKAAKRLYGGPDDLFKQCREYVFEQRAPLRAARKAKTSGKLKKPIRN